MNAPGNTGPISFPDVPASSTVGDSTVQQGFGISKDYATRAASLIDESVATTVAKTLKATPAGSPAAVLNGGVVFVLAVKSINPTTGAFVTAENVVAFHTDRTLIDNQAVVAHADITVAPAVNAGAVDFVITNANAAARKLVIELWALGGKGQRFNFSQV